MNCLVYFLYISSFHPNKNNWIIPKLSMDPGMRDHDLFFPLLLNKVGQNPSKNLLTQQNHFDKTVLL